MFHNKKINYRAIASKAGRLAKQSAPLLICGAVGAVHCFAAASPLSKLLTDLSTEATGTWATAGACIGLVVGLIGLKFGGHDAKGAMVTLTILSFTLLSVNGVVTYLQGE
jgi:hypothetical protein